MFLAPSYHEGQPLTVLEAMSHGRCVVASDISAHAELLGTTGVLFERGNTAALEHVLHDVLSDRERVSALGEQARHRVLDSGEYTWDHVATETEKILVAL